MNDSSNNFLNNPEKLTALSAILREQRIILAFEKLRAGGIEPILIKGWSIARFYPASVKRPTGDIDLCVAPENYPMALQIVRSLDFRVGEIDLHRGLRHLDKNPFADALANSHIVRLHNADIRVLCPEDNLRITCVHWLNDGGANREKLWDIYYLVNRRPPNFDWERCLNAAGLKRRQWIVTAVAVAHQYLNLEITDLPFCAEIRNNSVIPLWLTTALEKEWRDETKLIGLNVILKSRNWRQLPAQLRKRIFPNPIQASIETEAPFDNSSRLPYQIADIALRLQRLMKKTIFRSEL